MPVTTCPGQEIIRKSNSHQLKFFSTNSVRDTIQGFYVPQARSSINPVLCKALKNYATRYYQLKIGHGALGAFLVRIGAVETSDCWWCGAQEQTVIHLYTECRRCRRERRKLSRELGQHGISWQPRPERRWLGSLLANERAVGPVLRFLKCTEVGSRAGARQRELEWQRRSDQEGENPLTG